MADAAREQIRRPNATYQDVLDAPEHMVAEIIDGELVLSARPASRHSRLALHLGGALLPFDGASGSGEGPADPGGWWLCSEPELHFGARVIVPDLAGWRRERLPEFPDVAHFELAPDWVCELLTPSTARHDRIAKQAVYLRQGVAWMWFVDSGAQSLEVYRRQGEGDDAGWRLAGAWAEQQKVRAEPFQAIELDLGRLWA